jgi:hypothetical protein
VALGENEGTPFLILAPNPTRGASVLRLSLEAPGPVSVAVHDAAGRRLRLLETDPLPAGPQAIVLDGSDGRGAPLPAGVYFCRVRADGRVADRKLVIAR